jgi:uncharacterized protein YndB with AHSA1/START domain
MKIENTPDFPVTDEACKQATGKTLKDWFKELDRIDALAKGRRETIVYIYGIKADPWWPTTIFVEYEKHKGIMKKDGRPEGYSICATKTIKASVDKVYKTWTDPDAFAEMYGDSPKQEIREGGTLSCKAGTKATFARVRPNKDLRLTWEHKGITAPVQIDIQFQDAKGKTLMNVMPSRVQTRAEADSLRRAWGAALDKLKLMCES